MIPMAAAVMPKLAEAQMAALWLCSRLPTSFSPNQ